MRWLILISGGTMFLKPKNERIAIGTFVGVFAFDAVFGSTITTGHMGFFLLLLAVNFPGFLLITVLAPILTRFGGEEAGLLGTVIAGLFSAAFWAFIFGSVLPIKRAA